MRPFLFDSGVFLAARDRDDSFHASSRELIEAASDGRRPAFALDLTLLEVANVATVRWKSIVEAERLRGLIVTAVERIVRVEIDYPVGEVFRLAAEESISVYDAAYAECARQHDWQLVSTDIRDLLSGGLALDPGAAVAEANQQAAEEQGPE